MAGATWNRFCAKLHELVKLRINSFALTVARGCVAVDFP
jgi:hypothetical protein